MEDSTKSNAFVYLIKYIYYKNFVFPSDKKYKEKQRIISKY